MNITELNQKEIISIAGGQEAEAAPAAVEETLPTKGWGETIYGPAMDGFNWLFDIDWKTVGVGGGALVGAYRGLPYAIGAVARGWKSFRSGARTVSEKTKQK